MAGKTYGKKQYDKKSDFNVLAADLKANQIPNVLLLYGKEELLTDMAVERIVKKYVNAATETMDFSRFEGEKVTLDDIIESCETMSIMSEKRVVLVEDFRPLEVEYSKTFSEKNVEALCQYIKTMPNTTVLVFAGKAANPKTRLCSTIKSAGRLYNFDTLSEVELKSFIIKSLKGKGKFCTEHVLDEIIAVSGYSQREAGYTLLNLENDIVKIAAHSKEEQVLIADVVAGVSGNIEKSAYALVDSIAEGRKGDAYRILDNIASSGEPLKLFLGLTISQYELILKVRELRDQGNNQDSIAKFMGIHPYRIKKAWIFSQKYTSDKLKDILKNAYEVSINSKTGLLSERLAFEMFIAQA